MIFVSSLGGRGTHKGEGEHINIRLHIGRYLFYLFLEVLDSDTRTAGKLLKLLLGKHSRSS